MHYPNVRIATMACGSCGGETKAEDRFCGSCGSLRETAAPGEALCVGCGSELGAEASACPNCGAAARGASFREPCVLPPFRKAESPKACCCCLGEPTRIEHDAAMGQGLEFAVDVPWCESCQRRNALLRQMAISAALAAGALAVAVSINAGMEGLASIVAAFVAAGVAFAGVAQALPRMTAAFAPRGHVRGCAAYGGAEVLLAEGTGKFFGSVTFHNRAFARLFERINRR